MANIFGGLFNWGNNGSSSTPNNGFWEYTDPNSGDVFRTSASNFQNADIRNALVDSGVDLNNMTFNPMDGATNNLTSGNGFLGLSGNTWAGLGGIAQGLSGLASAYTGYKAYQLAKDQFNFQKGLANRNLANQAKVINNTYDNAAQVAAGMIGGTDSKGNFGMTDQAIVDRYANNAKKKHVDGSPI